MKRISYIGLSAVLAFAVGFAVYAFATPNINSVVYDEFVWGDCPPPVSVMTIVDDYPNQIVMTNSNMICTGGWGNRHAWTLSEDATNKAEFHNADNFKFSANVVLRGDSEGEGGLRISPWWWPEGDGNFMLNTVTGEIACFAGRLPFYSFTAEHGVSYTKGETVHMAMEYHRNNLSAADPATVQYTLIIGGTEYTSGPLPFDEGNPAEDPPHGLWGMLTPAYVGGWLLCLVQEGDTFEGEWTDICFQDLSPVQVEDTTWGQVKDTYR